MNYIYIWLYTYIPMYLYTYITHCNTQWRAYARAKAHMDGPATRTRSALIVAYTPEPQAEAPMTAQTAQDFDSKRT